MFRVTGAGSLFDNDFERVAFVLVEQVVDRAGGCGPDTARTS